MARYTGAVCRLCRREGQKLFLKGERCYTGNCALARRAYAPGQHGQGRKKSSEYGLQLRAKQRARRYYGVLEKQFSHYFDLATKIKEGKTGENLLSLLESRLDNVIYRLGWAGSRPEARQLVVHNHFLVNGKKTNIPSILVKDGDVITLSESSKKSPKFKNIIESGTSKPVPKWLELDMNKLEAKKLNKPERADIDLEVEETLIVELYSK